MSARRIVCLLCLERRAPAALSAMVALFHPAIIELIADPRSPVSAGLVCAGCCARFAGGLDLVRRHRRMTLMSGIAAAAVKNPGAVAAAVTRAAARKVSR